MQTSAALARARLLTDQAARPCTERRAALDILSRRLDAAGRAAVRRLVWVRASGDRRFAAVLRQLDDVRQP